PEEPYVLEALQAGVVGYVLKTQAAVDIVQAIHTALQGAIYLSPRVTNAVVQAYLACTTQPSDPLTSREREIVQRIAEGQTTKEIAAHLGLSVKTIESHRINLMRKLDIHETATLVRYAIRRGLPTPWRTCCGEHPLPPPSSHVPPSHLRQPCRHLEGIFDTAQGRITDGAVASSDTAFVHCTKLHQQDFGASRQPAFRWLNQH